MALQYLINTETGVASLDIFVGGIVVTTYTFNDNTNEVTLSELENDAALNASSLSSNLSQIGTWVGIVLTTFTPPVGNREEFTEETKKTSTKIDVKFKVGNDTISDAQYEDSTKLFTFKQRSEKTLPLQCFLAWIEFLRRFLITGEKF